VGSGPQGGPAGRSAAPRAAWPAWVGRAGTAYGIANAAPGSFADAFFFSVQTMGTIGYGSMYPATRLPDAVVVAESDTGLVVTALATGLIFVRFSQTRVRVIFSSNVAIGPMDAVPTAMVRVGNERSGRIVGATFRLTLMRTTRTAEGVVVYRTDDLPLLRDRANALARSWMILHRIERGRPLLGDTPESLDACEAELTLAVAGTDETSLQPVHAQHTWGHRSSVWGARLADVTSETPDGNLLVDMGRFHELTQTEPTSEFRCGRGIHPLPREGTPPRRGRFRERANGRIPGTPTSPGRYPEFRRPARDEVFAGGRPAVYGYGR